MTTAQNLITEREFQRQIVELARLLGWRIHHGRPAMTRRGHWVTPIQGDPGFPDLVLARSDRCIFAELKRDGTNPTPDQLLWLASLQESGNEVYVWRPSGWPAIERALKR